tara:strand:- start:2692 stop:3294 length:603 start_codon:yes stop_codon:yes gene_type:complete
MSSLLDVNEVNEVNEVTEASKVTELNDENDVNDEVNEVNEVNDDVNNKVREKVNRVNTSLDAALNGLHISKPNDVNKYQVVKEKVKVSVKGNEEMIEETEEFIHQLLFRYNPMGTKKDFATLADEWKEAPGIVKQRPVDGAVQKLLDHASSGQMLQVATTAVTLFQNLPRRKNGLCVGQTDTQDGNVAIMEVCIDDIVLT